MLELIENPLTCKFKPGERYRGLCKPFRREEFTIKEVIISSNTVMYYYQDGVTLIGARPAHEFVLGVNIERVL